jgi:hypothetical protein
MPRMDARFALIHFLCALAALVAAAALSAPADHPRARPWLCSAFFVLGVGELYVVALSIGLTLMWPVLHLFGVVWLLLPALLWRHFSESGPDIRRLPLRLRQV